MLRSNHRSGSGAVACAQQGGHTQKQLQHLGQKHTSLCVGRTGLPSSLGIFPLASSWHLLRLSREITRDILSVLMLIWRSTTFLVMLTPVYWSGQAALTGFPSNSSQMNTFRGIEIGRCGCFADGLQVG